MMEEFGPIINMSSMRFEAFHLPFKKYAAVTKNRKDLCYSLAERFQLGQSDVFLQNSAFPNLIISYSQCENFVTTITMLNTNKKNM